MKSFVNLKLNRLQTINATLLIGLRARRAPDAATHYHTSTRFSPLFHYYRTTPKPSHQSTTPPHPITYLGIGRWRRGWLHGGRICTHWGASSAGCWSPFSRLWKATNCLEGEGKSHRTPLSSYILLREGLSATVAEKPNQRKKHKKRLSNVWQAGFATVMYLISLNIGIFAALDHFECCCNLVMMFSTSLVVWSMFGWCNW